MARPSLWSRTVSWAARRWRGLFGVRHIVPTVRVAGAYDVASRGPVALLAEATRESHYLVDPQELRDLVAKSPEARYGLSLIASEIAGRRVILSAFDANGERYDLPDDHPAMVFLRTRIRGYTLRSYVERQVINLHFGAFCAEVRGRPSPIAPDVAMLIPHDPEDVVPKLTDDETTLGGFRVLSGAGRERQVPVDRMVYGPIAPLNGGVDRFTGISPFYSLLPELETQSRDALYQRDKPRGTAANLTIKSSSKSIVDMKRTMEGMSLVRERTGFTPVPKGYDVDALPPTKEQDDILARGATIKKRITLTLGLAPVLMDESVTNDSAAHEQRRQMHSGMQSITRHLWAQHEGLLRLLARPGEMAAGLHLRTDWSDVLDAEERASEAADLELEAKRAEAMKTYREAGLAIESAAKRVGIDPTTMEADDGQDRDAGLGADRHGLRAVRTRAS